MSGSDYGFLPDLYEAITWTSADLSSIRCLETNFEFLIKIKK